MSERMSDEEWQRIKDSRAGLGHWIEKPVVQELDRARAREVELEGDKAFLRAELEELNEEANTLHKRVAELEDALKQEYDRGRRHEVVESAEFDGVPNIDSRIRRIVREEMRKARIETVVESSPTRELVSVSQPFANATWPDETEATDG